MTTLVAVESANGSTREIAERIAATLRNNKGVNAVVEDLDGAKKLLNRVDAVVVAAPVNNGTWNKKATAFVAANRAELEPKSLFLVASGASPVLDPEVKTVLEAFKPRGIGYLRGAVFEEKTGLLGRLKMKYTGGSYGDFRDWDAVDSWAKEIANRGAA